MTNYNKRLDKQLNYLMKYSYKYGRCEIPPSENPPLIITRQAKQAIISLIKELVAESKPYRETIIDKWNKDRLNEVKATNAAMNAWADIYEQNILKALEEVRVGQRTSKVPRWHI